MNFSSVLYLLLVSTLGIWGSYFLPLKMGRLRLLTGPALGIVATTELLSVTSLLIGFSSLSIISALVICSVIFTVLTGFNKSKLSFAETFHLRKVLFNHWPLPLILATVGATVLYIFSTKVLTPTEFGLVTGGGGLFGDTALHGAYTMSLVEQGLPPTNPLFAGIPLVYPFLVNLFSASLVKLGMSLRFAFILPQLLYFLGFTTLFYWLAKKVGEISSRHPGVPYSGTIGSQMRFYRPSASRMTANLTTFLALFIFFLGWGWGFNLYLKQAISTGNWAITQEFTNNLPGFSMHNVLTGLILPERSFLPGLFIGMLITCFFVDNFVIARSPDIHRDKLRNEAISKIATGRNFDPRNDVSKTILAGILLGILPLWHTHTFIFFGVSVGIWLITKVFLTQRSERTKTIKQSLLIIGISIIIALPALLWFRQQVTHTSFIKFISGWMDSHTNPILFWFKNTGLLIPLSVVGIITLNSKMRWLFLPALIMFFVANFVQFQPWDWDNIKIFSWVFLFFSIAAGFGLSRLISPRMVAGKREARAMTPPRWTDSMLYYSKLIICFIIILTLTASGTLSLILMSKQEFTIYDQKDMELADWVRKNTQPTDVFLIDPWPNHPIPGLTGRSVYLGYPGHLWVHGISYGEREQETKQFFGGDKSVLSKLAVLLDYIVVSNNSPLFPQTTPLFQNSKHRVYSKMAKTTGVNPWMKPSNEREAHKAEQKTATVRSSDFYTKTSLER